MTLYIIIFLGHARHDNSKSVEMTALVRHSAHARVNVIDKIRDEMNADEWPFRCAQQTKSHQRRISFENPLINLTMAPVKRFS